MAYSFGTFTPIFDSSGNFIGVVNPNQTKLLLPKILSSSGIPIGRPSSGSVAANGALSGLTAFQTTYSDGCFLFFPAGAVFAGSAAGYYWTVMSSTTAGTIFNFTYGSGGGQLLKPTNPPAVAAAGPGAYTQSIVAAPSISATLPANFLGLNGRVEYAANWCGDNSPTAPGNFVGQNFGGLGINGQLRQDAANSNYGLLGTIYNAGQTNRQRGLNGGQGDVSLQAGSMDRFTIDTTQPVLCEININIGAATDWVMVEGHKIIAYAN